MKTSRSIDWSTADFYDEHSISETYFNHQPGKRKAFILTGLALGIAVMALFRAYSGGWSVHFERPLIVMLLLSYVFIRYPLGRSKWWESQSIFLMMIDRLLLVASILSGIYALWGDVFKPTANIMIGSIRVDHLVGLIVIILVLEATRRTIGWTVAVLTIVFISWSLWGNFLPGILGIPPLRWTYLVEILFVREEGVYGIGVEVLLSMLLVFLIFGTMLQGTKTGAFFIALANSLFGRQVGGPAKAALFSSAIMGTMSGAAIANVITTGSITIPMMIRTGYKPRFAAAVEAVASNGGQIMPPIMGASAFLMSAYLHIPYSQLVLYAFIPAILYYWSVYITVDSRARLEGLCGMTPEEVPPFWNVLRQGGHLLAPIILFIVLMSKHYSAGYVGLVGIITILALSFVLKETRLNPRRLLAVMADGVDNIMVVSIATVVVSVLSGTIIASGLGIKLSNIIIQVSASSVPLALVLTALLAIILGMGMPPVMVYITLAIFLIPAVVTMGLHPLAAHMFAFYYSIVSGITPPVCQVAFAAAGIAKTPPMSTGLVATRVGIASLLLPFIFIYHLPLLGQGSVTEIISAIIFALAGLYMFASGVEGYLLNKLSAAERILLMLGGLLSIWPGILSSTSGLLIGGLVWGWQKWGKTNTAN